ncbi:hypothetical protein BFP70_06515 [Thioclava sp. SK-1]|uniref:DUF3576 domain-containing protein n=1 Tax=Thioclava sp. SK-1 TaxID=1889770 RepID=UPI0008255180|nr:DUF3576 domain-containing protein [Thioclava sp. SK-1]OCX65792.1 hypothetical protein BFP70_06515 [Thioclava sp. SK-1]
MTILNSIRAGAMLGLILVISGCGISSGNMFSFGNRASQGDTQADAYLAQREERLRARTNSRNDRTIWDAFSQDDPNVTVEVNKYLWQASLDVLDFLPIQSVDPFSGVIVTGYGTPPGGGRAYRATILVSDPALDARSLKVSLQSRGGTVSGDTVRAVEDAILTRARQLRVTDSNL